VGVGEAVCRAPPQLKENATAMMGTVESDLPPEFRTTENVTDYLFGTVRRALR
jgi:hypothetical protein